MGARQKLMQISNQLRSEIVRLNEGERKVRENMTAIEGTISQMQDKLVEHKQYIAEYGQDLPEIRAWKWQA